MSKLFIWHSSRGMRHGLFIGDLDEVDFIETVEARFGVAFDEADYPTWVTLGDIHTSLMKRLGKIEHAGGQCASQMVFYRLRKAAGPVHAKARPDTRLDALGLGKPAMTMRALRCGLTMPGAQMGPLGIWAVMIAMAAFIVLSVAWIKTDGALAAGATLIFFAALILAKSAPRHFPDGIETLGDLAKAVALQNPMMLKALGAGLRPGDIWASLCVLASEASGLAAEDFAPDTPFIQQKVKAA